LQLRRRLHHLQLQPAGQLRWTEPLLEAGRESHFMPSSRF
jgi:hypothetical protein